MLSDWGPGLTGVGASFTHNEPLKKTLFCDICLTQFPASTKTKTQKRGQRQLTLALLVQEDAGQLSLIEDVQECLLGLACHLGQGEPLSDGGHEAPLDHVHDQHHLSCVANLTCPGQRIVVTSQESCGEGLSAHPHPCLDPPLHPGEAPFTCP